MSGAGPSAASSATIEVRVSGFTAACSVSIMNHSKPNPRRASMHTRDADEIHVPKQGSRDARSRFLRGFFMDYAPTHRSNESFPGLPWAAVREVRVADFGLRGGSDGACGAKSPVVRVWG